MKLHPLLSTALLCALAVPAFAAPVSGTTAGVWVSPVPSASPIVTTGTGTPNFTWGDASTFGTGPNSLTFGAASFTSVTETPFKVGTVTYFNGTTVIGSNPDSIQLALTLTFGTPAIPAVTSNYTFNLITTPNTGTDEDNADIVNLPSGFSTTSFLIGATTYNVRLTGFLNVVGDGFLTSSATQFHVIEGRTASADLYAVVTTQVATIPEPGSYALLFAGLGLMGLVIRRRSR